ncbi:hypothetical protein [Aliterella atlantica]|nr:hypothetical protein [Aliterella atlantica]
MSPSWECEYSIKRRLTASSAHSFQPQPGLVSDGFCPDLTAWMNKPIPGLFFQFAIAYPKYSKASGTLFG